MEMGDSKDKVREEDVGVTLPQGDRLRRSRRVRKLAPLPPSPSDGGGSSAAGERKRAHRQEAGEPNEEGVTSDGDEVKVMKSVKLSTNAMDSLVNEVGGEGGEEEAAKRSLRRQQPHLRVDNGGAHQSKKVGGTAVKLGEASSSSVIVSSAVGGSEDGLFEQSAREEGAHDCLFIEDILEVVFKHVMDRAGSNYLNRGPISKDVQTIRLVCKAWRDPATRVYRQYRDAKSFDQTSLTQFMDMMKAIKIIPVQKFSFGGSVFAQENLFRDFLLLCGPKVVSLDLWIKSSDGERMKLNLENLPHLNMLKLRALKLHMNDDHERKVKVESSRVHGIVSLVQLLLTAAKELKELDLSYWPKCCSSYWSKCCSSYWSGQVIIMQQLGPIIATVIPRTVKQLELFLEINEPTFNTLAAVGLELEKFELGVSAVLGRRALYEFIQSQAATLKHVRLYNPSCHTGIIVEFPRLDELVKLELQCVTINTTARSDFATTFPKLHYLDVQNMYTEDALSALLSSVKMPSHSLKVVHLPNRSYASLAPLMKTVAQSFPCIAELVIMLHHSSKDTMLEVFKYFDNLESLEISFFNEVGLSQTSRSHYWADSLFSGISELDCSRIIQLQGFENVSLNDFQRQTSILNLTKLRKLSVENCTGGNRVSFTDFAAHFVFLEMESLREVCFSSYATQFSPRYVDLLRERFIARGPVFDK